MDVATSLIVTLWNGTSLQVKSVLSVVLIWLKRLLRRKVSPSVQTRIVLQIRSLKRKRASRLGKNLAKILKVIRI